eukprot:7065126-Alexandrium_andersonii.AAC.1
MGRLRAYRGLPTARAGGLGDKLEVGMPIIRSRTYIIPMVLAPNPRHDNTNTNDVAAIHLVTLAEADARPSKCQLAAVILAQSCMVADGAIESSMLDHAVVAPLGAATPEAAFVATVEPPLDADAPAANPSADAIAAAVAAALLGVRRRCLGGMDLP